MTSFSQHQSLSLHAQALAGAGNACDGLWAGPGRGLPGVADTERQRSATSTDAQIFTGRPTPPSRSATQRNRHHSSPKDGTKTTLSRPNDECAPETHHRRTALRPEKRDTHHSTPNPTLAQLPLHSPARLQTLPHPPSPPQHPPAKAKEAHHPSSSATQRQRRVVRCRPTR